MDARLRDQLGATLHVIPATSFYRLTEAEFGMPGLVAIESVGPFVDVARVGPFVTIHDSFLDPGLGIDHHPHRGNERLFYILDGEIHHDDSLNGIKGVMQEGDLARLTEGEIGMMHREWNGRDDVRTHAFILVYAADPPVERASFDALRAGDIVRVDEAPAVETLQLIGGESQFRTSNGAITSFFDSTLGTSAAIDVELGPGQGLILYPLAGAMQLDAGEDGTSLLRGSSTMHPEGPDEVAIAWSSADARRLHVQVAEAPARLLRIAFARGDDDLVVRRPWRGSDDRW